jgi:zinc protease
MEEVRVKRGWSYGAHARIAVERAGGYYLLNAAPTSTYAPETVALLLSEFDRFVHEGLRDDEIEFARSYLVNAYPFRIETPGLRASQWVQSRLLGRPEDYVAQYVPRLKALSCDEVRDAVRRRLTPADLLVVMVCTADEVRPKMEALPGLTDLRIISHEADESAVP